jgi:ribonuclease D
MRPATLAELVRAAVKQGTGFYLRGGQIGVLHPERLDPETKTPLKSQRDELWRFLGGAALDQPPLDLMARHFPGIRIVQPASEREALEVIAQLEAEADIHAAPDAAGHPPPGRGLIGLDIETAANAGEEEKQSVVITAAGQVVRKPPLDPLAIRNPRHPASTAGLDPRRSSVRLVQLYGGGTVCMVLDMQLVPLRVLVPVLGRRKLVIHNAAFELGFFHHAGIAVPAFECTLQAAGLMLGVHRRSLDDAARHYLGIQVPKDLQTSDWGADVLSPGQVAYAALDAIVTLKLHFILRVALLKARRARAYAVQRAAIPATARMQARGILLDREAHRAQLDQWALARADARRAFIQLTGTDPPATSAQIIALLEKKLAAEILRNWPRTAKTNKLSTSTDDLKPSRPIFPRSRSSLGSRGTRNCCPRSAPSWRSVSVAMDASGPASTWPARKRAACRPAARTFNKCRAIRTSEIVSSPRTGTCWLWRIIP